MKAIACLCFVLATCLAQSATVAAPPAWLADYLKRSNEQRQDALDIAEVKLKDSDLHLRMMRKGKIDTSLRDGVHQKPGKIPSYQFSSKETKQRAVKSAEHRLEQLRNEVEALRANNPPYYATLQNPLPSVGDVGRLHFDGVTIEQIQGPSDFLATVQHAFVVPAVRQVGDTQSQALKSNRQEQLVWISGMDTSQLSDHSTNRLSCVFHVVGNKTYETVAGASRTVAHLEVVPEEVLAGR